VSTGRKVFQVSKPRTAFASAKRVTTAAKELKGVHGSAMRGAGAGLALGGLVASIAGDSRQNYHMKQISNKRVSKGVEEMATSVWGVDHGLVSKKFTKQADDDESKETAPDDEAAEFAALRMKRKEKDKKKDKEVGKAFSPGSALSALGGASRKVGSVASGLGRKTMSLKPVSATVTGTKGFASGAKTGFKTGASMPTNNPGFNAPNTGAAAGIFASNKKVQAGAAGVGALGIGGAVAHGINGKRR
jgi:hypothetical protein